MATATKAPLPPRLRTPARLPRGPEYLLSPEQRVTGPGEPPPGFLRPRTSATEWMVYWALAKIFDNPDDPRVPPFDGAWPFWTYQKGIGQSPGRAVVDFIVYRETRRGRPVGIRVQTEYRHLFTSNQQQSYDRLQLLSLSGYLDVMDIYDTDFLNDKTGQAVIVVVKNAIGLLKHPDPLIAGTARRAGRMENRGG